MSKSAEIHKQNFPYCHPFVKEPQPSRAARFIAENWPKRERSERKIVDAGCGEGQDTLFLINEGFHVIAVDVSERNLGILSQKVTEAQIPSDLFVYYAADLVEKIPIENATVDAVLDVWVLGSVILPHDGRKGAKQYLAEVHRILKPGGVFALQFETIKPRRSPEKLKEYLANLMKGRFSIIASESIDVDYVLYVDVPHKEKLNPALFTIARKK